MSKTTHEEIEQLARRVQLTKMPDLAPQVESNLNMKLTPELEAEIEKIIQDKINEEKEIALHESYTLTDNEREELGYGLTNRNRERAEAYINSQQEYPIDCQAKDNAYFKKHAHDYNIDFTNPKDSQFQEPTIENDSINPKDLIGITKTPVSLLPTEGILHGAMAMKHGSEKYGAYNWRDKKIQYTIYLDAILRHVIQCIDREDVDKDSGLHPLAHVIAGASIVLDAIKHDCLIDNRPGKKQ